MSENKTKLIFIEKIAKLWDYRGILIKNLEFVGWDGKSQIDENKAYILSHLVGWEGGYRKRPMPNPGIY